MKSGGILEWTSTQAFWGKPSKLYDTETNEGINPLCVWKSDTRKPQDPKNEGLRVRPSIRRDKGTEMGEHVAHTCTCDLFTHQPLESAMKRARIKFLVWRGENYGVRNFNNFKNRKQGRNLRESHHWIKSICFDK